MGSISKEYYSDNQQLTEGYILFQKYNFYLLILRWSVIFASAVIYFTTTSDTGTVIPPYIVLIILLAINLPLTFYIYNSTRRIRITVIILLDIMQGSLAVLFTGGYDSLFFVLYLLSFFEAGLFFDWQKATGWIVSIDSLQVAATTFHWTAMHAPVSTYALVSRFMRLLIVGLIVIVLGVLLRREEENKRKALLSAMDLKLLNKIFRQLEGAGFDKNKIFKILLSGIHQIKNVAYTFIIFRTNASGDLWKIKATDNHSLFPIGKILTHLIHYKDDTSIFRSHTFDGYKNPDFFKAGAEEVIGINLADSSEGEKGLLIIGKSSKSLHLADEDFFLKALALETQLVLHNTYAYQDKQKQIKKLDKFKEIQSTFFSAAGHEIKTPLTILKTLHATLGITIKNPTRNQLEILQTMESNINRLDNLTTDILETAKLETADLPLNKEEVQLVEIIQNRVNAMEPLAIKKSQEIQFEITQLSDTTDFPPVYGDKKRLSEIISNLLSNAIKFSPRESTILIRMIEKSDFAEIGIFDSGPLLSEHEQERIFNKYYTSSPDKALTGFGLGLYIVKKLIELHNGTIWVETEMNRKGFCFTLPYYSGETDEKV